MSTQVGVDLIHEDPSRRLRHLDIGVAARTFKGQFAMDVCLAASSLRLYRCRPQKCREPKMATLDAITEKFREAVGGGHDLGKTLKFDLKNEGVVFIDGPTVSNEDAPADLTITTTSADLADLSAGRLDPMTAVMTGKLKLSDMGLAMQLQPKLQALFGQLR
jgi:putative sterol carrier protein